MNETAQPDASVTSAPLLFADLFQPLADDLLEAVLARLVVAPALERLRPMLLANDVALVIVRVLVPFAVAELFGERRGRVADHQRHRQRAVRFDVGESLVH